MVKPPYLAAIGEGGNRWINGASMENWGLEFNLGYRNKTRFGMAYDINANISTYRNKVTKLPADVQNSYGGDGDKDNIFGASVEFSLWLCGGRHLQNTRRCGQCSPNKTVRDWDASATVT